MKFSTLFLQMICNEHGVVSSKRIIAIWITLALTVVLVAGAFIPLPISEPVIEALTWIALTSMSASAAEKFSQRKKNNSPTYEETPNGPLE